MQRVPEEPGFGSHTDERRGFVPRGVRLLDAEPDLASEMSPEELAEAQQHVVLPTITLDPGQWDVNELHKTHGVQGEVHGFLVLAGAVTIDLAIGGLVCTRLLTPGELILVDGWESDSIPVRAGWTVLEPSTIAILDQRLIANACRWPGLMTAILKRAAQQVRHALLQQAISQLPRVEERLLALLWSIADRQGVVRATGVWVHLPVTHATLAQMIGARRPTVSLGLRALSDLGLITAQDRGWLLAPTSRDAFLAPTARPDVVERTDPGAPNA
jgi:CRP/FNR family cyclic AMP-dependent transcriptional regulator